MINSPEYGLQSELAVWIFDATCIIYFQTNILQKHKVFGDAWMISSWLLWNIVSMCKIRMRIRLHYEVVEFLTEKKNEHGPYQKEWYDNYIVGWFDGWGVLPICTEQHQQVFGSKLKIKYSCTFSSHPIRLMKWGRRLLFLR